MTLAALRWRRGALLLVLTALTACSGGRPPSSARDALQPSPTGRPGTTAAPQAGGPVTGVTTTASASPGSRPIAATSPARSAAPAPACRDAAGGAAPNAGGDGAQISYTGTGTGSYTTRGGTGLSYAFPPRWTYVWRAGEQLVELTGTDALGTWGIAAASTDEALSRITGVYLTAPDGTGGSMTYPLRFAAPIPFTELAAGATTSGRAADDSVLVTIHRPGPARAFDLVLRSGRCRAADGIGAGTIAVVLEGATAPWSAMRFDFDVRLEDDRLKGSLQLRRG